MRDAGTVAVSVLANGTTTAATINGGTWTATVPLPAEGKVSLRVDAKDASGHSTSATVPLLVDRSKPVIEVTDAGQPFTATIANRAVAPIVRAQDLDERTTLTVTLDGQPYVSGTTIAAEGLHTLRARAQDCAGHLSDEKVLAFTIDRTAPVIISTTPANGASLGARAPVAGTLSEEASVAIEGTALASPFATTFSIQDALQEGTNRLVLVATDRAGNSARLPYVVTLRTTAPTVEILESGSPIRAHRNTSSPGSPARRALPRSGSR